MDYRVAQKLFCLKYSNQDKKAIKQALQDPKESYLKGAAINWIQFEKLPSSEWYPFLSFYGIAHCKWDDTGDIQLLILPRNTFLLFVIH